jgi:GNAT superfamily N-acetyltransferase
MDFTIKPTSWYKFLFMATPRFGSTPMTTTLTSGTVDLRSEAESIERRALIDLHAAADDQLRDALGLRLETVDGATVSIVAGVPSIVLNRVQGLGLVEPAHRESVARIRNLYREAGIERFFLHHSDAAQPPELADWLELAGLKPQRRWMKFVRDAQQPCESRASSLTVKAADPDTAADFGEIAAQGFGLTPEAGRLVSNLVNRPGWRVFLTFDGDTPVGTGALFVAGDVGWCDWASTRPDYRGYGSQGALLARRIAEARSLGCRTIYATTGEAVPGDPQHSYRNLQRAGFRELYSRDNYAPSEGA